MIRTIYTYISKLIWKYLAASNLLYDIDEIEIREVISKLESNKAPGPDQLLTEYFNSCDEYSLQFSPIGAEPCRPPTTLGHFALLNEANILPQSYLAFRTGGKPSTWFPPGELVEQDLKS